MNQIIPADTEQQKDILWKKYLSKKKSFAKAQFQLSEYQKVVRPAFDRWLSSFAGDRFGECLMIRYELKRYDENILTFDRLCRILKKSASEVLFAIQTECIEQNKFFWGIVREQYEKASAEAEQRFRDRLKAMMGDDSSENTKRLWEAFDRLNEAADPRERHNLRQVAPEKEEPEQAGEIKKLYRTLCLRHHPDKTGVYNEKLWLEIQDAYEKGSVKKLRELLKRPVAKPDDTSFGLSCEEIQSMIDALEKEFKPVRADLRSAKKSPAWDFLKWDERKREERREDLSRQADESLARLQQQRDQRKATVAGFFRPNQRFKKVQIIVSRDVGKKASYTIRMIYGKHEKTLPIRRGVKQPDSIFAERCAVTGLSALKAPCRVSFILPDKLLASLRPVEAGFIFGDELGNLVSRHIVNFTDMRDEYDFSNASKV